MAGQEGLEPPTSGFGDRRSTNSSYWPAQTDLLNLFMSLMGPAPLAVLLKLEPIRHVLLVLGGNVVLTLARRALKSDFVLHG